MIATRVDAEGLMNQMGDEIVPSYSSTGKDLDTVIDELLAYQRKANPITKGTIEPTWEDLSDWISPDNHNDYSGTWTSEAYAYDESESTRAVDNAVPTGNWSGMLGLLFTAGLSCSKIKVLVEVAGDDTGCLLDVDVWYGSGWIGAYYGSFTNNEWVEIDLGYTEDVTAMRIRLYNGTGITRNCYIYEADFWGVEGGKLEFENRSLLWAILQLFDIVGEGYIEVDNDRQLNWWNDIGEDKGQQIRYRKNIGGISREVDWGAQCTKLYPLSGDADVVLSEITVSREVVDKSSDASYGYLTLSSQYSCYDSWTGEGNALPSHIVVYEDGAVVTSNWRQGEDEHILRCAIGDYDAGAVYKVTYRRADYLIAWDETPTYGLIAKVWTDYNIGTLGTLLELGRAKLTEIKTPPITYVVDAVDLAEFDGFSFDELQLGSIMTVIDEDLDVDVSVRITKIVKPDLLYPAKMQLELSNKTKILADTISEIKRNL